MVFDIDGGQDASAITLFLFPSSASFMPSAVISFMTYLLRRYMVFKGDGINIENNE